MRKLAKNYLNFLIPIFFFLLVLLLYYPVFLQGYWAINSSDAVHLHLPNNTIVADSFRRGSLPLWNPNFNLGQPTIDGSTTLFHPFLVLFLMFNPWLANTIEVLLGLVLIFLGAWYFLKQQRFENFPALMGAIIYGLSGPVFFLHSYHLGFMAVLLLPWCLFLFHLHDSTQDIKWLWLGSLLCILGVHSLDVDTLAYLYLGFVLDRLICFPKKQKNIYILKWLVVFLLTSFSGFAVYLPLYQWLAYSSRMMKSYNGILPPGLLNLWSAIISNRWLEDWPYDVFYFYFGPAVLWFVITGLRFLDKFNYVFRYFKYSLIIFLIYHLNVFFPELFKSFDLWRSMFVFCLGLAMVSVVGITNILKNKQKFADYIVVSLLIILFIVALGKNINLRILLILLATLIIMSVVVLTKIRESKLFSAIAISAVIAVTLGLAAMHHAIGTYYCIRYKTEITENLPFYDNLSRDEEGSFAHWRTSIFGCTYNLTSLAGLKTLPNYTPLYNKNFERSLSNDNLIIPNGTHPYWMNLKNSYADVLSVYGVRFLITNKYDLCVQPPWDNCCSDLNKEGWIERKDLTWFKHRVWENSRYIGRAYIVSSDGKRYSGVEFLKDFATEVILKVKANEGDRIVLADLYYPGWQAYLDNSPVKTDIYHGCLRSVVVNKGVHVVSWKYAGKIEKIGLAISCSSILLLVLFLCFMSIFFNKKRFN